MNRQAQAVVLLLAGAALWWADLTGLYLRYVKAALGPLLFVAGAVLIVAAVATLWSEWRRPRATEEDGHGHAHREPRVSWLMVLPLLALILVGPPALGSYTANRTGTALQPPFGFPPLPSGDPLQLSVDDYAGRAVYDHGKSLGDRQIDITGFITVGPRGAPYLTRMVLNCCAADAQPIKVGLSGQVPHAMRADAWFEVLGTYTATQAKDDVNGGPIPFIDVSKATSVPVPHDPYDG